MYNGIVCTFLVTTITTKCMVAIGIMHTMTSNASRVGRVDGKLEFVVDAKEESYQCESVFDGLLGHRNDWDMPCEGIIYLEGSGNAQSDVCRHNCRAPLE